MIHKCLQFIIFTLLMVGCASQPNSYVNFTKMSVDEVARWPAEQICRWKAEIWGGFFSVHEDYYHLRDKANRALQKKQFFTTAEMALIKARKIQVGMSELAAYCSWGMFPRDTNDTVGSWGRHRQSVMGNDIYFYFEDGKLTSWQE